MKLSKLLAVVIIFSLLPAMLIGCARQNPATVPTPAPAPIPAPAPVPTSTPMPALTPLDAELPLSSYLPEIPRISAEEVKAKSDAGVNLVIIDSRSETNYAYSHIKGAISIPLSIMVEPYIDLDSYEEIMIYCA